MDSFLRSPLRRIKTWELLTRHPVRPGRQRSSIPGAAVLDGRSASLTNLENG